MVADIHWLLAVGSVAVPLSMWMMTRIIWLIGLIPVFLVLSYLLTSKDMFRIEVLSTDRPKIASVRSRENWEGAKTYEPR